MLPTSRSGGWNAGTNNAPVLPILLPIPHLASYSVGPQDGAPRTALLVSTADLIIYGGHRSVVVQIRQSDASYGTDVMLSIGEVYGTLLLDRVAVNFIDAPDESVVVVLPDPWSGYRAQVRIGGFEVLRRSNNYPTHNTVPVYQSTVYAARFDFVNGELLLTTRAIDGLYWTYDPSFGIIVSTTQRGGKVVLVDASYTDFIHIIVP